MENIAYDLFESVVISFRLEPQLEIFPHETAADDRFIFRALVDQWRRERGPTSSTVDMAVCPSYQKIIGMGPRAVPLILSELESEGGHPDHWFWALQALTGINPVTEEDEGDLPRMAREWLEWARAQGYAW